MIGFSQKPTAKQEYYLCPVCKDPHCISADQCLVKQKYEEKSRTHTPVVNDRFRKFLQHFTKFDLLGHCTEIVAIHHPGKPYHVKYSPHPYLSNTNIRPDLLLLLPNPTLVHNGMFVLWVWKYWGDIFMKYEDCIVKGKFATEMIHCIIEHLTQPHAQTMMLDMLVVSPEYIGDYWKTLLEET